jgi:hypothetical protein
MIEMRNAYKILVRKQAGKRPLRRPRHRWEDIRIELREIRWKGVDWMHLAQDRDQCWVLVNMINETSGSIKVKYLQYLNDY